jgi:hypothetical protein
MNKIVLVAAAALAALGQDAKPQVDELTALKTEVARLKGIVPDQAHAMPDVGSHFTNLWFAGQNDSWPLAQFLLDETKSHLRWAVRIIPKRKDVEGREIDLQGILTALESSTLKDLDLSIKEKDRAKFTATYKAQLEGCMATRPPTSRTSACGSRGRRTPGVLEFRRMSETCAGTIRRPPQASSSAWGRWSGPACSSTPASRPAWRGRRAGGPRTGGRARRRATDYRAPSSR